MLIRIGSLVLVAALVAGVTGCKDGKENPQPNKDANLQLKSLPTPGSPGGNTKKAAGGGVAAQ